MNKKLTGDGINYLEFSLNKKNKFKCPFCYKTHQHGAMIGHRIAHCNEQPIIIEYNGEKYNNKHGYYVTLINTAMTRKLTEIQKENKTCTLYLIGKKNTDFVKIGISNEINQRLKTLQGVYYTDELELLGLFYFNVKAEASRKYALDVEKKLHSILANKRVQYEWFSLTHEEILLTHQLISMCFNTSYAGKMDGLRDRINNYQPEVFIAGQSPIPYFFNS